MGQAQSNQHQHQQYQQHRRHRSFLGYHHHRNHASTSSRSTSARTNGSTSTNITNLTNNSNHQILSISGSSPTPISSNIQSSHQSNNSISINQSDLNQHNQPNNSINLNQSRNTNRFLPLHSLLKRSHRRSTTAEPQTSSSSISQQTCLNSGSSSPNPSSVTPASSIPTSSTHPRHHRRPSWNTFLRHSFSPSRSSNRSSIPRFDTPISTPDQTHHRKQSNSQVLPLIDLQSPLPSLNSTITTIQSSNSNSPSTSDLVQNSSTTSSPSILTDSHLIQDQKEDLSSHSSIYPNTLTSLHSHSTTTDHLSSTLSSSNALLTNNNLSSSPSLEHVHEDHEHNEEAGLGLDLSSTQELETSPNSEPPTTATARPLSGVQVPTRRIYVQGMVVARNVPDQSIPNPSPRPLEQSERPQTIHQDELMPNVISDDQIQESTNQTTSTNPSSVLIEQATMISRLLSVAAAATASSLLPNSINPDGTTISNTTPPLSPSPMTTNAEQVELHGGLQNTLRDALRVAFGSALMNGVTPTHQIPIPTPVPSSPMTPSPSSPIDRTIHTGSRIMRRLGLQSLLNHRNGEEEEPETTPESENDHSFENFLSSLQTDVGDAILEALGGNTSEEENEDETFNFFRMHRFENGVGGEEGLIPVLLVGVRSVPPNPTQRGGRTGEDEEETQDRAGDDEGMFEGIRELFEEPDREASEEEDQFWMDEEEERENEEAENRANGSSELLEPSEPSSVPLAPPSIDPAPTTQASSTPPQEPRSWLIFVLAGLYPPLHPIFNTPTEYIPEGNQQLGETDSETRRNLHHNNRLDYETMMRLAELIGVHKPMTVTANEIENADLTLIQFKQDNIEKVLKDGDVLENTVEKCLICLEDYVDDETLRLLKCKHLFHKNCVDQWLMTGSATCPTCRDVAV